MRRHRNLDDDIPVEDAGAALQQAFALLLPIRRQRLRRSERAQREADRALRDTVTRSDQLAEQLAEQQTRYLALRDGFAERHLAVTQKQERLMQGLTQERGACDAVAGHKNALVQCQRLTEVQTAQLEEARRETQARQRDVEKLEYMIQESEVLR